MILSRCFPWDPRADPDEPDGPLWFPREFQGGGRHDNPDLYGCLYLSRQPVSAVVEQLARFRGQRLRPELLVRRSLPLALAALELSDRAELVDLDDPKVLSRERLRPSLVATRDRLVTQPQARSVYRDEKGAAGIAWWSTFESLWANVTLFDRARPSLEVAEVERLTTEHGAVVGAASFLGL